MTTTTKKCSKCKTIKSLDLFFKQRSAKDGLHSQCKACHTADVLARMKTPEGKRQLAAAAKRKMEKPGAKEERRLRYADYSRRKRYGLSQNDYEELLRRQNFKCAVCLKDLDLHRRTHVDHCHSTNKVRGILCHSCNTAIGLAGDDADRLRAMAAYLTKQSVSIRAEHDAVNHPSHYNSSPAKCACGAGIECIQVVEHMGFSLGNSTKYLWRAGLKSGASPVEDLKKSAWYIAREIQRLEREGKE